MGAEGGVGNTAKAPTQHVDLEALLPENCRNLTLTFLYLVRFGRAKREPFQFLQYHSIYSNRPENKRWFKPPFPLPWLCR